MIYVTIAHYGKYDESGERVVYVGNDKNKAFDQREDGWYHSFTVEFWHNEVKIKEWYKNESEWELIFDKINELERSLQRKHEEIDKEQQMLYTLRENLEN